MNKLTSSQKIILKSLKKEFSKLSDHHTIKVKLVIETSIDISWQEDMHATTTAMYERAAYAKLHEAYEKQEDKLIEAYNKKIARFNTKCDAFAFIIGMLPAEFFDEYILGFPIDTKKLKND